MIKDPYSGKQVYVIPALKPDFAIIHANEVDEEGNVRVYGTPYWDRVISRGSNRILVTAEKIVPREEIQKRPELTLIPGFMVEAVSICPQGAWPGSCYPYYDFDETAIEQYLQQSKTPEGIHEHLASSPEIQMKGVELDA
jgi:glutaconate CoA-transferase subunit A